MTQNSFLNAMFSAACLYAATLFIYGMLSLHQTAFGKRKDALTKMYGTPIPEAPKSAELSRFGRMKLFSKHFFLRPNFVAGIMMGVLVIRNYANPATSCVLAFGLSAVMLSELHKYETKFIPIMSVLIGVLYGTAHIIGYMNNWHYADLTEVVLAPLAEASLDAVANEVQEVKDAILHAAGKMEL